jgi:hypothetical protein
MDAWFIQTLHTRMNNMDLAQWCLTILLLVIIIGGAWLLLELAEALLRRLTQ